MELDDALHAQITQLSDQGNALMDAESYAKAVDVFSRALELVPEPKTDWEASTWLNASIGDARFQQRDFRGALEAFLDAFNGPGGPTNPFILLRLGECFYESTDLPRAQDHLMRAYMLEGSEIFDAEHPKYFSLIKPHMSAS